ncbi:hypothetical protein QSV08_16870 [Maribacter sp. BPC-D8]|uniref:hypothetical protein n=1 Tax=Maribacter sp. BPC-D8 TaxID=3053613 RepID=UPI002B4A7990|nr:hypothetical protein [Maribacter sp. BPC-D8]WRI28881.1 hypothetical protein QSV08_16870 [Maribacter sp. BPC-D8]
MNDIHPIYQNDFGIAFQWKREKPNEANKVQVIFRDIGLLLTKSELRHFSKCIADTVENGKDTICGDCKTKDSCRSLLLNTPAHQITFAVSYQEAIEVRDLINGTMFKLELDSYFGELGIE